MKNKKGNKLSNNAKLQLIIEDLGQWVDNGDSDCSMVYAYNQNYHLHAATLWLSTGALSKNVAKRVKGVKINQKLEDKEVDKILKNAFIYTCEDCNHLAFLDSDKGSSWPCQNCLGTCFRNLK